MWVFDSGVHVGREVLKKVVATYIKEYKSVEFSAWDVYKCIKRFTIENDFCCYYLFNSYLLYGGPQGCPNAYDAWRDELESEINMILQDDYNGRITSSIEDVQPHMFRTDNIFVQKEEVDKQVLEESILAVLKCQKLRVEAYENAEHFIVIDKRFCARCIEEYIVKKQLCCQCLFDKPGYFDLRNKVKLLTPNVLEKLVEKNEFVKKHDPKHDPNPGGSINMSYWFSTETVVTEISENHALTEFF